jgi:hypothetical protein
MVESALLSLDLIGESSKVSKEFVLFLDSRVRENEIQIDL